MDRSLNKGGASSFYNNLIINIVCRILFLLGSLLTSCRKSYCYCFLHNRVSVFDNWIHRSVWFKAQHLAKDQVVKRPHVCIQYIITSVFFVLFVPPFRARNLQSQVCNVIMELYTMWSNKNENAVSNMYYMEVSWTCITRSLIPSSWVTT